MEEVLKYITLDEYNREKKKLKDGEDKVIYIDKRVKIKIMKQNNKVYNIFCYFGSMAIQDVVKELVYAYV